MAPAEIWLILGGVSAVLVAWLAAAVGSALARITPAHAEELAEDDNEPQPGLLGDVVLCPEVAEKQGAAAGHGTTDELHLLTTHGILHLLGYDHGDPEEKAEMFALQTELLAAWRRQNAGGREAGRQTQPTEG